MKIAIGCDPNAEEAKKRLIDYITREGLGLSLIHIYILKVPKKRRTPSVRCQRIPVWIQCIWGDCL